MRWCATHGWSGRDGVPIAAALRGIPGCAACAIRPLVAIADDGEHLPTVDRRRGVVARPYDVEELRRLIEGDVTAHKVIRAGARPRRASRAAVCTSSGDRPTSPFATRSTTIPPFLMGGARFSSRAAALCVGARCAAPAPDAGASGAMRRSRAC